jgi:hypothetical protein
LLAWPKAGDKEAAVKAAQSRTVTRREPGKLMCLLWLLGHPDRNGSVSPFELVGNAACRIASLKWPNHESLSSTRIGRD